MSVIFNTPKHQPIRDLSHFKRNVVLELFGRSKRHIPNKENVPFFSQALEAQLTQKTNKKYPAKPIITNPGSILTLLQKTDDNSTPLSRRSNKKNQETSDIELRQSRKKIINLEIKEPVVQCKNIISPHRDFRSQFSFDQLPLPASRKASVVFVQPTLPAASSVKRSSSFRDLFKSSIKLG